MARPKSSSLMVPAALQGGREKMSEIDRASGVAAVEMFVDQLGGRQAVIEALEVAADQPEVDLVLSLLADPRYSTWTLRRLCQQAGLTIQEFFAAFRSATLVRAQIRATARIADGLVPVVEDVMRRAAPYEEICTECEGTGSVTPEPTKKVPNPGPEPCKSCKSLGKTTIFPDLDRQKLALELADLVKKGGGIAIQNNQLNLAGGAVGTAAGDLEKLQQALAGGNFAVAGPEKPPEITVEAEILSQADNGVEAT